MYVWHLHAGSRGIAPLHLQFSICRRPSRTPRQHSLPPVSHTLVGSPALFVLDLQEFIDHIALDSYYDCISGSSSSFSLGYIFVMHGCVDPHALDFFILGLIRSATSTVQDEDPLAFMITHLLHKWIYLWRLPTHAAIIVAVAVG